MPGGAVRAGIGLAVDHRVNEAMEYVGDAKQCGKGNRLKRGPERGDSNMHPGIQA